MVSYSRFLIYIRGLEDLRAGRRAMSPAGRDSAKGSL